MSEYNLGCDFQHPDLSYCQLPSSGSSIYCVAHNEPESESEKFFAHLNNGEVVIREIAPNYREHINDRYVFVISPKATQSTGDIYSPAYETKSV